MQDQKGVPAIGMARDVTTEISHLAFSGAGTSLTHGP